MNTKIYSLLTTFFVIVGIEAAPPQDPAKQDYTIIMSKDPFGPLKAITPIPSNKGTLTKKTVNYVLKSVSKLDGKWLVSVVDKRNPKKLIMLSQGILDKPSGIKLKNVIMPKDDVKSTEAELLVNNRLQTVTFIWKNSPSSLKKSVPASQKDPSKSKP